MSGRRRLTASARVALAMTLVLLAGVSTLTALAYLSARIRLAAESDRALLREAQAYAAAVEKPVSTDVRDLRTATRAYLRARSPSGAGLAPLLLVAFETTSPPGWSVISNADVRLEDAPDNVGLTGPGNSGFADVTLGGTTYRVISSPVNGPGGVRVAVFQAALPRSANDAVSRQLGISLALIGLIVVLVGALLSVWAARASLQPLRDIARVSEEITHRRLAQRVPFDGPRDEVGTLAESLNAMLDRLEEAFGEQRRFIADASHELRTPLAIMQAGLETLDRPRLSADEREETIGVLTSELQHFSRLVDDLLDLARLDAGETMRVQELDACTMLVEAAARGRALGANVRAECPDQLWVMADPDRLDRALLNVVANAVRHSPPGGLVVLSASPAERDGQALVRLRVSDSGPGIAEKDLPRIFDRFYRESGQRSSESGGSGLGLAITQRLIELHDGTVAAENKPSGGAVFTIELPRIDAPSD